MKTWKSLGTAALTGVAALGLLASTALAEIKVGFHRFDIVRHGLVDTCAARKWRLRNSTPRAA